MPARTSTDVEKRSRWTWGGIAVGTLVVQALALWAMGRVPICTCGYVKLWHGVVNSSENSQHLLDWYSFTHILHGFIFYWILKKLLPRLPAHARFALAVIVEASWEILENSPFIIERYRAATISLDYYGDSIVNSISDALCCMAGFVIAHRLPVAATIGLAIAMELFVLYFIRDNLTLNVIMLIYPIDAIKQWQAAVIR
jgi:hypothetical protein